jgi:2-isopropylmalate synthase
MTGMTKKRFIKIFDTTLRDGEQSPGASMNLAEKMEVAQALVDLGVDVIEAGFPIASPGDFEAVKEIANSFSATTIAGLARCNEADIDRAWEALKDAANKRIHVFLATSAIHREFKLKMTPDQIISNAVAGVKRAAKYCDDVEFSPEDASRTEIEFLCEVVEAVIAAGATTVNIPDTVGYAIPSHISNVISSLRERVPNIDKAIISIHCHNDLGLAVANSLAAVEAGAGQIECTINGIGERAGNCSLEEVVMAMRTRSDFYHCDTKIDSRQLVPTSRLVSAITGLAVQRNKAVVGRNAFAHEAGIHQDGMLKERRTYEIMRPEDVGLSKTDLVLGKHSGRAALADRAKSLGYQLNREQLQSVFEEFKNLADKKKEIYDDDIVGIIEHKVHGITDDEWMLEDFEITVTKSDHPVVKITLKKGPLVETVELNEGDGPIDATFLSVQRATGMNIACKDFHVRSTTFGQKAEAEVIVEVDHEGSTYRGRGVSTDSIEASILAILNAINRITISQRLASTE